MYTGNIINRKAAHYICVKIGHKTKCLFRIYVLSNKQYTLPKKLAKLSRLLVSKVGKNMEIYLL